MDEQVYVGGLYLAAHDCGRSFMECNRRSMWRVLGYYCLVAWDEGARLWLPSFCRVLHVRPQAASGDFDGVMVQCSFLFVFVLRWSLSWAGSGLRFLHSPSAFGSLLSFDDFSIMHIDTIFALLPKYWLPYQRWNGGISLKCHTEGKVGQIVAIGGR